MANVRPARSAVYLSDQCGGELTVDTRIRAELHHSSRSVVSLGEFEAGFREAVDGCRAQDLCLDEPGTPSACRVGLGWLAYQGAM